MTAALTDRLQHRPRTRASDPVALTARSTRQNALALARFIAAGCAGNVVYSLVFLALAQSTDNVTVPSVIASIVSTLAVNEAHRLWTFRGIGRPSLLQAHLSGAASALVGTGLIAGALLVWTWMQPDASLSSDVAMSWAITALVGAGNFLHLRGASSGCANRRPSSNSHGGQQQHHPDMDPRPKVTAAADHTNISTSWESA